MRLCTLIMCTAATIIFLIGVISMIVVRTDVTPNWKKLGKVLIWIIGLTIFRFLVWGTINYHGDKKKEVVNRQEESPQNLLVGNLVFEWILPSGQTKLGYNKHAVDVEITRDDTQMFWAELYDSSSGVTVKVGNLHLGKTVSGDLVGTWSNYLDGDGGQCFLYKKEGYWKGYHTLSSGRKIDCILRNK
jgi:hypothetical protein